MEEYNKEIEVTIIRIGVYKNHNVTMARFLGNMNRDIANIVELQHYINLEDMVHIATEIERQLKFKGSSTGTTSFAFEFNSRWSKNYENKKFEDKSLSTD